MAVCGIAIATACSASGAGAQPVIGMTQERAVLQGGGRSTACISRLPGCNDHHHFIILSLFPVAVFDRGKVGRVPRQGNPESDALTGGAAAAGGLAAA